MKKTTWIIILCIILSSYFVSSEDIMIISWGYNDPYGYSDNFCFGQNPLLNNTYIAPCVPNIINSSYTAWVDMQECQENYLKQQNRSYTVYDSNSCGVFVSYTIFEFRNITCTFFDFSHLDICNYDKINILPCYYIIENKHNCTYEIVNQTNNLVYVGNTSNYFANLSYIYLNLTTYGTYQINFCNQSIKFITVTPYGGDIKMFELAISVILIGILFFFVYFGNKISSKDDNGNINGFGVLYKMLFYASAMFTLWIIIQTAYAISSTYMPNSAIDNTILQLYHYALQVGLIGLYLFIIGLIIAIFIWIYNKLRKRKK